MSLSYSTTVPLYSVKLQLRITDSSTIFEREGLPDACAGVVTRSKPFSLLVLLRPGASAGTIAHEALHVVRRVLERAGIAFSASTEETYAYLLDWTVEWLTKKAQNHAHPQPSPTP